MKCPHCRTRQLVVIGMDVAGERVALHSCSACEVRWWQDGSGRVDLDGVLQMVGRR